MKHIKVVLPTILFTLLIAACSNKEEDDYMTQQNTTINDYWNSIDSTKYEKIIEQDVYYIEIKKGDETQRISIGDSIFFLYTGAVLTSSGIVSSNIFDTNIVKVAHDLNLSDSTGRDTCRAVAGKGHFIKGLDIGLLQMCKGEKAHIIFTSDLGYGGKPVNIIPKYSPIIFEVEMTDVKKQ